MKKTLTLAALGLACVGGSLALARRSPSQRVASTTSMLPPPPGARAEEDASDSGVQAAFDVGDDARAARLLDAALAKAARRGDPHGGGVILHDLRRRLLTKRGRESEAIDETLALLRGSYGGYDTDPLTLVPVLEAALRLRRARDADAIATWIEERDGYTVSEFPALNKPKDPGTPTERLAYAYLALAQQDRAGPVRYAERAGRVDPKSLPVLVQLAHAYLDRGAKGDRERATRAYERAYALLPEGSITRCDLRYWAYGWARIDPAGPDATGTLEFDRARSRETERRRRETADFVNAHRWVGPVEGRDDTSFTPGLRPLSPVR